MLKKRILSGMRPTGKLHLGHLVGALDNWVKLQEEYDCFFMIADWHALMSEYENPADLKANTLDIALDWLACGIDPKKSTIFVQSQVREHLELYMFFSLITPLGPLERCPTYKEQLREVRNRDLSTYGFLGYPVLQAADILLYKAGVVPVGEDQLPHLELTRQIARKFNHLYKSTLFPEPQALLTKEARLLGLDGRKMSKSYNNYISLSEDAETIRKKVQSMFTDPARVRLSDPGHPEKCNLHNYYAVFAPQRKKEIDAACRAARIGCTECKKEMAEILVKFLGPIRKKREAILEDKSALIGILSEGKKKAEEAASRTIKEVKALLRLGD
ncbi:MAG: tryptophan--tRNA ligase [Omnitrophica WOR_2 bacterium RIFCSPLOWO2_12_FULL_51_8]|nr:MAG: tryptophan--tRNA ligase [Omnitrophica WOR_2 bacterium RIFCSPLOWO2_12_FULL_51_8]